MLRHDLQAADSTVGGWREAILTALQGGTATLAVHVAEGYDLAGRAVDLDSLPVHANGGAVAVGLAAGETGGASISERAYLPDD